MTVSHILYELVETTYRCGHTERVAYGIAAYDIRNDEEYAVPMVAVNDIASDKGAVLTLIEACNRLHLSPCHLHDVVEDFLS